MKKVIITTVAVVLVAMISFRAGVAWEHRERTQVIIDQWAKLHNWTNDEGQTFREQIEGIEFSPEQAANFVENVGKVNDATLKQIENDTVVSTLNCMIILKALERGETDQAKAFCIQRIANYYHEASKPGYALGIGAEMEASKKKVLNSIEKLAAENPDLQNALQAEE